MTPADAIIFPWRLSRPLTLSANIVGSTITPGQTQDGVFPLGRFDGGGAWVATLNQVYLAEDDDVRAFRAVRMLAQGGVMPVVVPRNDAMLPPFPLINGAVVSSYPDLSFDDDTFFSDGVGFYQEVITAVTVGSASLRGTSITIDIQTGGSLRGGECFSLFTAAQGWRMHEITTIAQSGFNFTVNFEPPLRDDVPSGTVVEFDRPRCTMRLLKSDSMDIEFSTWPFPRPTVSFIEYPYFS